MGEEKQDLLRALNADDMKAGVGVGVGVGGERARQIAEELDAEEVPMERHSGERQEVPWEHCKAPRTERQRVR